ncbi:MAG: Nre family DNA repair protein [Candidatus Micrarchaeia archaeon]
MVGDESSLQVKRSDIVYKHMQDPALLRYYYKIKTISDINIKNFELSGTSPTDIFIGRYNYPNVYVGPLVPPEFGDTSALGTPERWRDFSIEKIVEFRSKLVRGMYPVKATDVDKNKIVQQIQELAMAEKFENTSMNFTGKPIVKLELKDEVQPFGPSVYMKNLEIPNIKAEKHIEKMSLDYDAKASTALTELYNKNIEISKIQRAFSAGLFGMRDKRRLIPTRWSITAVDDTLSKYNLNEVKSYDCIDSIYTFFNTSLDNRWLIFFVPGNWQYESMEAWWPKTIWNENGSSISIYSSYESYYGRKTYAEIGGCYYAARLAVTEKLKQLKRQAVVIILREVHEGYTMPVGVWNVREHVRETLSNNPIILHSIDEMLSIIKEKLSISPEEWIKNGRLLANLYKQKRLSLF